MAKVLRFTIGQSVDFFQVEEEDQVQPVLSGQTRTQTPHFVPPAIEGLQLGVQEAQNRLRAAQIKQWLAEPQGFTFEPAKGQPNVLVRKPIPRGFVSPATLAERFPVAAPPGAIPQGGRSIYKGTITFPDGTVQALYEPEGREPFIRTRAAGAAEFGPARLLFGGQPLVTAEEEEIRRLQGEVRRLTKPAPETPVPIVREELFPVEFAGGTAATLGPPEAAPSGISFPLTPMVALP